jgi:Zinc carboxypeptidase
MNAIKDILKLYDTFSEKSINNRFFKHSDLIRLLNSFRYVDFIIEHIGNSFEGRSINLLKLGTGSTRIFLWSQMHGDEATGTMALFDLLNFFSLPDNNSLKADILNECILYILPMLNPDGTEIFTRRNIQEIDINRDFNAPQSPEGKLLRELRDTIQPDFGFNLHDQSTLWSAGDSGNPATISLLAPAFDKELSVNEVREKAMQVISCIHRELQEIIPDHTGLFKDEYEPRAFGDNFQKAGTSTILIEAGGYKNDPEKQYVRKLFFMALISGLECIAKNTFSKESLSGYYAIPENIKSHFHILLHNCTFLNNDIYYTADIGLVAEEKLNDNLRSVTYTYTVEDIGDLSGRFGYEEIDATGMKLIIIKPLICGNPADFILQDGLTTLLSVENGRITNKNF